MVQIAAATLSGNILGQNVYTHRASVHQAAKLVAALLRFAGVTAGLAESNGSLPRLYDSHHLQADCQEPGSASEPYSRQSSMGYLFYTTALSRRDRLLAINCNTEQVNRGYQTLPPVLPPGELL